MLGGNDVTDDDNDRSAELLYHLLEVLARLDERDRERITDLSAVTPPVELEGPEGIGPPPHGAKELGLVTTRETDDGFLAVADLPGVEPGAVDVRFDGASESLDILLNGSSVKTVPVPDPTLEIVDRSFRNGMLVVELA
jgi:HSP20 family molecular chaperone IbpA